MHSGTPVPLKIFYITPCHFGKIVVYSIRFLRERGFSPHFKILSDCVVCYQGHSPSFFRRWVPPSGDFLPPYDTSVSVPSDQGLRESCHSDRRRLNSAGSRLGVP